MYKKKIVKYEKIAHAMIYWVKALWLELEGSQFKPTWPWAGLRDQPHYEACGNLQLKIVKTQRVILG